MPLKKYRVEFSQHAQRSILEQGAYYAAISDALNKKFLVEVE